MKGLALLFLLAVPYCLQAQTTFVKVYANQDDYDTFNDMTLVSASEYAFITETFLYRVDAQGKVLLKKDLKEGISTFLESILHDGAGNFYITGHVFTSVTNSSLKLWKINSSGQVLNTQTIAGTGSLGSPRLAKGANNQLYLTWTHNPQPDDVHLDIAALDEQGRELWRKEVPRQLYNQYAIQTAANGSLELLFMSAGDQQTWLLQVSPSGTIREIAIHIVPPTGTAAFTTSFCTTPDGGHIFTGSVLSADKLSDGLLYKTDKDGNLLWQKQVNINRADGFTGIAATTDGYLLLCNSGGDDNWSSTTAGDMTLVKTDWQGSTQWVKAFGSAKSDYTNKILVPDANSILIGGKAFHPGYVVPMPTLIKTDGQGNITTTLPWQLTPPATFQKVSVNNTAPVQKLVKAVAAPDGSIIAGAHFQSTADDLVYPYLLKTNKTGQVTWQKQVATTPGIIRAVTNTRDGHHMALIEQKGFLSTQVFTMMKFNTQGDTLWTAPVYTSVLRDLIATSDGGYLLVGSEDLTLSNYDLLVIKTDANGKLLWKKKTGVTAQWETGRCVKETPEHDFIIAGNSQTAFDGTSQFYAVKVNRDGNLLWERTLSTGLNTNLLYDIALTPDGDYIMTGTTGPAYKEEQDIAMIKLNKQGLILWQKTYDLYLQDEGFSVQYTNNDTILVSGITGQPPVGKLEKFGYLMKLDKAGNKPHVQYFGKESVQSTVEKILLLENQEIILAGNTQEAYGKEYMYLTKAGVNLPVEQPAETALILYPNPTHSKVILSMKNNYNGPVNIVLYNTTGQQVMVLQRNKSSFEMKEEIPLTDLSSGMYYFFIQHEGDQSVKRLQIINR
jgi:hypothetical protein